MVNKNYISDKPVALRVIRSVHQILDADTLEVGVEYVKFRVVPGQDYRPDREFFPPGKLECVETFKVLSKPRSHKRGGVEEKSVEIEHYYTTERGAMNGNGQSHIRGRILLADIGLAPYRFCGWGQNAFVVPLIYKSQVEREYRENC